jgi:hypothetical protein
MSRTLILLGLILVVVGELWPDLACRLDLSASDLTQAHSISRSLEHESGVAPMLALAYFKRLIAMPRLRAIF